MLNCIIICRSFVLVSRPVIIACYGHLIRCSVQCLEKRSSSVLHRDSCIIENPSLYDHHLQRLRRLPYTAFCGEEFFRRITVARTFVISRLISVCRMAALHHCYSHLIRYSVSDVKCICFLRRVGKSRIITTSFILNHLLCDSICVYFLYE